jgi:NADPH2:quinone reductase
VIAITPHGGYAEQVVADSKRCVPMPAAMSWEHGAAFPVVFGTSHVALSHRARLRAGETLVVHGASGGVGLTAVAIGKQLGATVIATASSAGKLQVAGEHGADHLIDSSQEDVRARIKELTDGRGADVVYDPVGGDCSPLRCAASPSKGASWSSVLRAAAYRRSLPIICWSRMWT